MDIESKINNLILELKKDSNVLAVYLFGSYATGKHKVYSDIDVCIFLKDYSKSINYYGYGSNLVDISVFEKLPLPVKYKVFKEGKALYIENKELIENIKILTLRDYLNNKHRYDLQFEYMLNKPSVSL